MEDADDLDVFEEDAWEDDDAACRSKPRPPAIRGGLFGLLSVAGGNCFFGAFGLGGGRTRAGFGGSKPEQTTREKRIIL